MTGMQVGQVPTEGLKLAMTVIATGADYFIVSVPSEIFL